MHRWWTSIEKHSRYISSATLNRRWLSIQNGKIVLTKNFFNCPQQTIALSSKFCHNWNHHFWLSRRYHFISKIGQFSKFVHTKWKLYNSLNLCNFILTDMTAICTWRSNMKINSQGFLCHSLFRFSVKQDVTCPNSKLAWIMIKQHVQN